MKTAIRTIVLVLAVASSAQAQISGMGELDAGHEAKIARERAKQTAVRGARDEAARRAEREGGQCGSVGIGNFDSRGRFDRTPREINVFITGDVINADNRCR